MILKIDQQSIDRQKLPEDGWSLFEIQGYEVKPSKDKASTNFIFDCEVIQVQNGNAAAIGRHALVRFNSKAIGMGIPFFNAALDTSIDLEMNIDLDALKGKQFWGEVSPRTYEGRIQKEVTAFMSASNPPF